MEVSKSESDGGTQNVTGISKDILDDLCRYSITFFICVTQTIMSHRRSRVFL